MTDPVEPVGLVDPEDPADAATPATPADAEWHRLDSRMLLIYPVRELIRFLPVLLAVVVARTAAGSELWQGLFVLIPIALGLARYLTTSYRIASGRIELRRGLLERHLLSTPVDRVRTVDLTSSPIHRLLGLTTVRIGTGTGSSSGDERIDLDGLPVAQARALRQDLLRVARADPDPDAEPGPSADTVLRFDPAWVRFAPLTGGGLVIAAATVGVGTQLLQALGLWQDIDPEWYDDVGAPGLPVPILVFLLLLVGVVVVSILAIGGYVLTNWGFTLSRDRSAWHLRRGLLTTRETTLDEERVAGISLAEPWAMRLAHGARLSAIVTGLDSGQRSSSMLAPPAPREVVTRVAGVVLGTDSPVTGDLTPHGPQAIRRRYVRAVVPALIVAAAAAVAVVAGAPVGVLGVLAVVPLAALLAWDRARSLGHRLTEGHLVSRSGSVTRRRRVLEVEHVIGWNFSATWFQRRAGLTTLVATTAGGSQAVPVLDVPEGAAVEVAHAALPDLVAQFRLPDASVGEPLDETRGH